MEKCIKKHKNIYDYSLVNFTGVKNKITIICPVHGEFEQIAEKHFTYGCKFCGYEKTAEKNTLSTNQFMEIANEIHNFYYDYSLVDYKHNSLPIKIICPTHGLFEQIADYHLRGSGCTKCTHTISKKETRWLDILEIPNDTEHRNVYITINGRRFIFDGYLPAGKIVYEFLGDYWHGHPIKFPSDEMNEATKNTFGFLFRKTVEKIKFLRQNGFKVISIWETDFDRKFGKENEKRTNHR